MTSPIAQHADMVRAAIATNDAAKSAVIASWRRSAMLHNLDPAEHRLPGRLTETEFKCAWQQMEPLIRNAEANLDRLYLAVGGAGCCVLLADCNGVSVERRGASVDDKIFENWGLWTGTLWREEIAGTNGIGTCLVEGRPTTIDRDQHYFGRNTHLSCMTAPIYDCQGNITAVLNVSSCRADFTERFVNLISVAVCDTAQRIENENFRLSFPNARIMVVPTANRTLGALIAIDSEDIVVGATRLARTTLGITPETFASRVPATHFIGCGLHPPANLRTAERAVLERALAWSNGNVTAAARSLGISRSTFYRKICKFSAQLAVRSC